MTTDMISALSHYVPHLILRQINNLEIETISVVNLMISVCRIEYLPYTGLAG